ncbi:DUF6714 family protein [Qipengyuania sphaerica]|uniref:DUF6714 family protein n=1 Tax=Qipengyuania sphaerica TaxID=2867243 RepID=UPI001C87DC62|nr:DUF6714 family protein [Qipengyuania sphaerica]MBX7539443.1 hypothetical protein [Qipengyuania sphaerica]
MSRTTEALIAEIYAAFPAKRPHVFDPLVNSTQGEEPYETAEAFADKEDWTALEGQWVDQAANGWASALSFLSDEAVCFYLPAWLVADLRGQLMTSDPTFQLTHGFTVGTQEARIWPRKEATWTEYTKRRWASLTQAQVLAVVHYLEWRREQDVDDLDHGIEEALAFYWYKRAARPDRL